MNKKLEAAKQETAAEKLRADKIQHDLTYALQENIELRTGTTASESRVILVDTVLKREGDVELTYRLKDCSHLEDSINCGVCGLMMWTPYMYVLSPMKPRFRSTHIYPASPNADMSSAYPVSKIGSPLYSPNTR